MNEQQFRELSAARALHALVPDEEQAFSRALAAHPEWQSIVDVDRDTAAALGATAPEIAPPAAARGAILAMISSTTQFEAPLRPEATAQQAQPAPQLEASPQLEQQKQAEQPAQPERARNLPPELAGADDDVDDAEQTFSRPRRRAAWFALAASVAVLLVIALALPIGGMRAPRDPVSLALQQVGSANDARTVSAEMPGGGEATLHWADSVDEAVFVAEDMPAAPEAHDFELWIVRGEQPISLGVVRANNDGGAAVVAEGFEPGDALAVTVEEAGGSPTGLPTTDPVVVVAST
ncbi:anti-sigma factor [Leucobacter sp. USHLN153]|uniref:anti-sigma factor n=1 Tax=Leucobacter sp. USHLN153 TaxID=3081268 RepID=UPI003016057C